jgi:putative transposase
VTYYRWRQEYGGLRSDQVKRLKDLEAENVRLRRAVSDLTLDKIILAEALLGASNPRAPPRLHRPRSERVETVGAPDLPRAWAASVHPAGVPTEPDDEERLTADIVELTRRHGRLGYRKIAEMLRSTAGWIVNDMIQLAPGRHACAPSFDRFAAARTICASKSARSGMGMANLLCSQPESLRD